MGEQWNGEFGENCNLPIDCVHCDIVECPGRSSEVERRPFRLEDARFCPICGCELRKDGVKLLCDRHGAMSVYLAENPREAV